MNYMIEPFEPVLIDTNILTYSLDSTQGTKHILARDLLRMRIGGNQEIIFSQQNLVEFLSTVSKHNLPPQEARALIFTMVQSKLVRVITPSISDMAAAVVHAKQLRMSYWDALLAETMFENNVFTICTEDEAFRNDRRLNVINPFKKRSTF